MHPEVLAWSSAGPPWQASMSIPIGISEKETVVRLAFGDSKGYKQAMQHLGQGTNEFYLLLAQGTLKAAEHYGGKDFACVLGQEMAGYATGEV